MSAPIVPDSFPESLESDVRYMVTVVVALVPKSLDAAGTVTVPTMTVKKGLPGRTPELDAMAIRDACTLAGVNVSLRLMEHGWSLDRPATEPPSA